MVNDRSVRQVLPLKGEILVLVAAGYVGVQICDLHLLDKYIPHLIAGALVENFMYYFVFFHSKASYFESLRDGTKG